jgi:hypothetical protein
MQYLRRLSLLCVSLSSLIGMVRGVRMMMNPIAETVLFSYSDDRIKDTIFSNFRIFGMIFFCLVGVFSVITLLTIILRKRYFGYLMMVEGIFSSFFILTHIAYNGFTWVHLPALAIGALIVVLGVVQTPREF